MFCVVRSNFFRDFCILDLKLTIGSGFIVCLFVCLLVPSCTADFPTAEERTSILEAICNKVAVSDEVRAAFPAIAGCRECTTFTGADLQALMYSAQLEAARETLASGADTAPIVRFPHMTTAFKGTTGSVSDADRLRYRAMYDAFASGRGPSLDSPAGPPRVALK